MYDVLKSITNRVLSEHSDGTSAVNSSNQRHKHGSERVVADKNKQYIEDWKNWCRLCAKADAQYVNAISEQCLPTGPAVNIQPTMNMSTIIKDFFHVDINENDHLSTFICTECCQVVNSLVEFLENIKKVQKLYDDLLQAQSLEKSRSNDLTLEGNFDADNYIQIKVEDQVNNEETNINSYPEELIDDTGNKDQFYDPIGQENAQIDNCIKEEYLLRSSSDEDEQQCLQNMLNYESMANEDFSEDISESNYTCDICFHAFRQSVRYAAHMLKYHNKLICTHCFDSFENENNLKLHIKEYHQLYPCTKCNKIFQRTEYLFRHMKRIHDDEQSFFCEVCLSAFRLKAELEEHMLLHTDYLPHECTECGKCFQHRKNLKRHMLTHGDKYVCTVCGKQLNSPRTYKNHMLVHYDKTYHKCDYCGREFKRSKALKTHLILHSGLKPYSCEFCERTFSCRSYCRMHMKLKHPDELAALEASGERAYTTVPRLDELKSFVRSAENLQPVNVRRGRKLQPKSVDIEKYEIEALEDEIVTEHSTLL
ncbi:unnamed protein product [Ceratitis capitata]|uniref:(Mediterranean fruit fly) hypothetical protein n=1 Tax=Ceratitis capitata TaxID=7213 RepID=A0A811UDA0_CERCA|nr:unnamed protein product [Ceratitis capitata]